MIFIHSLQKQIIVVLIKDRNYNLNLESIFEPINMKILHKYNLISLLHINHDKLDQSSINETLF